MHYKCKKCNYEFEVFLQPHPHNNLSFINVGAYGCPICLKAQAKAKVCPKCGSVDLIQTLANSND